MNITHSLYLDTLAKIHRSPLRIFDAPETSQQPQQPQQEPNREQPQQQIETLRKEKDLLPCKLAGVVSVGCSLLLCDMIEGAVDRIIESSPLFSLLRVIGFDTRIVTTQEKSYVSTIENGQSEQFERIVLNVQAMMTGVRIYSAYTSLCNSFILYYPSLFFSWYRSPPPSLLIRF